MIESVEITITAEVNVNNWFIRVSLMIGLTGTCQCKCDKSPGTGESCDLMLCYK